MALYIGLNTYFALECPRTVFWGTTGERLVQCPRSPEHQLQYQFPPNAKYCPECATPLCVKETEHATPAFAAFAEELGVTPKAAFDELVAYNGGWEWAPDSGAKFSLTIKWHTIEPFLGERQKMHGLGFKLANESYFNPDGQQLSYTLTELAPYHIALMEVAKKFEIQADPRFYVQVETNS